ncbi:hypothetical protein BDM02DRAFT_2326426 [Thelephora ganbajun]|uniref:Uncharacterized protein n=1 Tax=Thelephora ganbajun TaxID=370292 RepID=A0ACB6ZFA0_THEGA|nr:hypothetical protein BDM02DRAFT_2326426 [Thelephora ganbajun]
MHYRLFVFFGLWICQSFTGVQHVGFSEDIPKLINLASCGASTFTDFHPAPSHQISFPFLRIAVPDPTRKSPSSCPSLFFFFFVFFKCADSASAHLNERGWLKVNEKNSKTKCQGSTFSELDLVLGRCSPNPLARRARSCSE